MTETYTQLCYNRSAWDEYAWKEYRSTYEAINETIAKGEERVNPSFGLFAAECYHRIFSHSPRLLAVIRPEAEWALVLHRLAEDAPSFGELEIRSSGDELMAGVGTHAFLLWLLENLPPSLPKAEGDPEKPNRLRDIARGLKEALDAAPPEEKPELEAKLDALKDEGRAAVFEAIKHKRAIEGCEELPEVIERAAAEALEAVLLVRVEMESFQGSDLPFEQQLALARSLQEKPMLKKIADLAGKLKVRAAEKRRVRSRLARTEIVGVTVGDDYMRMLPTELANLATAEGQAVWASRFMERNLLQYELGGKENLKRGPLVFLLDSTGSMGRDRQIWAKAMMLALAEIAIQDKRPFVVLHWGNGLLRRDDFPVGDVSVADLQATCEFFRGDSTNDEPASFRAAFKVIQEKEYSKADIVFLTDAGWLCGAGVSSPRAYSEVFAAELAKFRVEHNCHVYMLAVANDDRDAAKYVQPDRVLHIKDLASAAEVDALFEVL